MADSATRAVGAYGLRLSGADGLEQLLVQAPEAWTPLHLIRRAGVPMTAERVLPDRVVLVSATGTSIEVDRDPAQAVFTAPSRPAPNEVVHPYLASVAAVSAHWHGCESFHAGAIAAADGVWALVGEHESGKSATLASLEARGYPVVCDDMLVLRGTTALAGPRSIDLRPATARTLGLGTELGKVGTRERWRVRVGPVEPELELRGWIFLEWAESIELEELPAADLLARLVPARGLRLAPANPAALLDLALLPALVLRRPHDLAALPPTLDLLVEAIGEP